MPRRADQWTDLLIEQDRSFKLPTAVTRVLQLQNTILHILHPRVGKLVNAVVHVGEIIDVKISAHENFVVRNFWQNVLTGVTLKGYKVVKVSTSTMIAEKCLKNHMRLQ